MSRQEIGVFIRIVSSLRRCAHEETGHGERRVEKEEKKRKREGVHFLHFHGTFLFGARSPLLTCLPLAFSPPPPPPPTVPFPSVAFDLLLLCSPLEKKKNVRVWPVWLSLSRSLRLLFLFPSLGLSVGSTWRLLHFQFHSRQGESRP